MLTLVARLTTANNKVREVVDTLNRKTHVEVGLARQRPLCLKQN